MNAPNPSIERCAWASSTPSEPPSLPIIVRNMRVPNIHACSSRPRLPSGFSRLCSGPAPKPSSEIEKPATRTFVMTHPHSIVQQTHMGLFFFGKPVQPPHISRQPYRQTFRLLISLGNFGLLK